MSGDAGELQPAHYGVDLVSIPAARAAGVPSARPISSATILARPAGLECEPTGLRYAGYGQRLAAFIIDIIIVQLVGAVINSLFVAILLGGGISSTTILLSVFGPVLLGGAFAVFYSVWLESSPWQATVGKKALRLKVTDLQGRRISFWRSSSRNVGKTFSVLILGIGYLMPLWTQKKQALHDKMAKCLVVQVGA